MKKFRLIHPYLFVLYPLLWAYAANLTELQATMLIRPAIFLILLASVILVVSFYIFKDADKAAVLTSLIMVMLLNYGYYQRFPKDIHLLGISVNRHVILISLWLIFFAILSSNVIWKRVRPRVVSSYMLVLSLVLLILPIYSLYQVGTHFARDPLTKWQPTNYLGSETIEPKGGRLPDIYYIILDGYARADILQELYQFDNSEIIDFLKEKGFYIAENSQSNYTQTALSLASSLNFAYLDTLPQEIIHSRNKLPLQKLIQDSAIRNILHEAGYRFITSTSIYDWTEIKDADEYIASSQNTLSDLEMLLWDTSIVRAPIELFDLTVNFSGYDLHRDIVLQDLTRLPEVAKEEGAKFVFVHILAPHPPFVFDQDGNAINRYLGFTLLDGSHYNGSKDEYRAGYIDQLMFINGMLKQMVEGILDNSQEPPVIILQADHGPGMLLDHESREDTCLLERTSILNAYLLPGEDDPNLYPSITPVNTFRVLLNTYFNAGLDLLEDKVYYATWSQPYNFMDVSAESQSACEQVIANDPQNR